jgi:serine O-acetyltransferase
VGVGARRDDANAPIRPVEADVSAIDPDWSREHEARGEYAPGKRLLAALRSYQGARGPLAPLVRKLAELRHRLWSAVTSCDIPLDARIAGGLLLPHPSCIVVHPDAHVGPNCLLSQGVTIGTRAGLDGAPILEGHVDVGAGAKILGPIRIGAHAKIGANAVVLCDVPSGAVAVGIPARVTVPRRASA